MSSRSRRVGRLRRVLAGAVGAGAAVVLFAAPASAHVSVAESEVAAGGRATLTFGFGHGCDGSPTTRLRIAIPESVPTPQPVVQAGWSIEVQREALDEPVEVGHGETVTERISEIAFTADEPIDDGFRASVQVSLTAPDAAGTTLHFPVVQECSEGAANWTQIPAEGQDPDELDSPAPAVAVVAGEGDHGHAAETTAPAADESTTLPGSAEAADEPADEAAAADDSDEDTSDGASRGLAIAGLAIGVVGLVVAGRAMAAVSEMKKQQQP